MTAEQLMLYFNLALTALIVLGALRGFLQGFKKSLFKLIKELLFWVIFYLTADAFANFVLKSPQLFELVIQYVPIEGSPSDMVELVQQLLVQYVGVSPDANITSSISFAFAIVSIVLKLVYLLLYVTIFSILYNIVWGIIWRVFVNRKKIEIQFKEKKLRNGKIKKIKNKVDLRNAANGPRVLGLVFGGFRSMIGVTLIVSLLMSIISIFPKDFISSFNEESNVTASNQITLKEEDQDFLKDTFKELEEYVKFVDDLDNSPYVKLVRSIKSDETTLDLVLFDTVMNGNYEEYNIKTRESLSTMVEIGYDVALIVNECQTPDGKLDLSKVDFDQIGDLVEKVTEIDLLMEAIPVALELGLSMESITTSLPVPIDDELKQTLVSIDWRNDVVAIANVVRTLGEVKNLNEVMENPTTLLSKENEHIIYDIITQLSDLTLVTKVLPTAVEYAMQMDEVKELIGDATVDLSNIVWEEELVQIAEIYKVFLTLSSDITSLLFQEDLEVGDIIDGVNLNALNDLVLKVFELGIMEELFEPIMDIVVSKIEDESIREMLNFDVDNYEDWAKEFTIVIDIVKELLADGNPFENGVDVSIIKNINPETISKSKILSQVLIGALVDASNGEGIFAGDGAQELSSFIDVPTNLKDKDSPAWHNQYDAEGNLISKGQLHKTLEALQTIMPDDPKKELRVSDTYELSYTTSGIKDAPVVWMSTNPDVANINQDGVVTAIAPGHAIIIASSIDGKVKDMEDIIVRGDEVVPVEYVLIEGKPVYEIAIGIGQQNREFLSATTNLDATNQVLVFESLNEEVVKVSVDGAIEGVKAGEAIIKVTSAADATKFAICNVTVVEVLPDEIEVNKESLVGYPNKVFYVDATIKDSKEGLTYKIADETVASVDEIGFVTLLKEGQTTLTISKGTVKKVVNILVVNEQTPTKIEISDGSLGLDVNSLLSSLDEEDVDKIISSDVLTRSLSKILLNSFPDEGEEGIHIPLSVIETDGETKYICKEEIKNILDILLEVDLSIILGGSGDVTELLEDLDDDSIDAILESKVLSAFLSSTVSDIGEGMIVVPSSAYKNGEVDRCYIHEEKEVRYIKNSEVKALVKMLKDYDLLSGEEISIPLSEDNSELVDLIESSDILRATLSKFVIDMSQGSDAVIVVPDQAIETIDECKLLKVNEFKAVLDALYDLGFEEISTSLTLDLKVGDLKNAVDSINNSIVLRATVSNFIDPIDMIVLPDQSLELNAYTVNNENIKVITKDELKNLVEALTKLLKEDAKIDEIEFDLKVSDLSDEIDTINESLILRATITDFIAPIDVIVLPDQATDLDLYTVDDSYVKVIKSEELENLVKTLAELVEEDDTFEDISFDKLSIKDLKDNTDSINGSLILRATITDFVASIDMIKMPDQATDLDLYTVDSEDVKVIKSKELENLVNALVKLLGENTSFEEISLNLTVGDLTGSKTEIIDSTIIMATITDKLSGLEGIIVPDNVSDRTNYSIDDVKVPVIYDAELINLIDALGILLEETLSINELKFDLTVRDLVNAKDSINGSGILRTTITDKIIPITAIIVPDEVIEKDAYYKGSTYYPALTIAELNAFIDTLGTLLDSDESINDIKLNITVEKLNSSVNKINQSGILRATISDKINGVEMLIKPDQVYSDSFSKDGTPIKVLKDTELSALTASLNSLLESGTKVDEIQDKLNITVEKLINATDSINKSGILKTTVANKIVPNTTLVVPDEVVDYLSYSNGSAKLPALEDKELKYLVSALGKLLLPSTSLDNINLSISVKNLTESTDEINKSGILRATVANKIIKNEGLIVPNEVIDFTSFNKGETDVPVLKEIELEELVEAFGAVLKPDQTLDSVSLSLTFGEINSKISEIDDSIIIRATFSNKVNNISDLVRPDEAYDLGVYTKGDSNLAVLTTTELDALIGALTEIIGETKQLDGLELELEVSDLNTYADSINETLILRATIADKIDNSLVVPEDAIDVNEYHVNSESINLLSTTELTSLAKALVNILDEGSSLDTIEIPTDIFNSLLSPSDNPSKNKLEQSLDSIIIWDKISTMILDSTGALIVVPDDAKVGGTSIAKDRITVKEINSLMKALNILGVGNIENVSLDANFIFDLDDDTKDALGNTELTRTTIALEKSKIMMASIPSLFETGIQSAYKPEDNVTFEIEGKELRGTLNAEETAYISEGELVRLFRATRAANSLKDVELENVTGRISDENSNVYKINKAFLAIYASEILRPTATKVLENVLGQDGLTIDCAERITTSLAEAAAINDLQKAAAEAIMSGKHSTQVGIVVATQTTNIHAVANITAPNKEDLGTYAEVEAALDVAIAAINAI